MRTPGLSVGLYVLGFVLSFAPDATTQTLSQTLQRCSAFQSGFCTDLRPSAGLTEAERDVAVHEFGLFPRGSSTSIGLDIQPYPLWDDYYDPSPYFRGRYGRWPGRYGHGYVRGPRYRYGPWRWHAPVTHSSPRLGPGRVGGRGRLGR